MFTEEDQSFPQVDGTRPIHPELSDGGPSRRRLALDPQEIGTPPEMIASPLPAGVEQGHELTRLRIYCFSEFVFMVVTSIATEGHIVQFGLPAD
jgi:hypothetical protein